MTNDTETTTPNQTLEINSIAMFLINGAMGAFMERVEDLINMKVEAKLQDLIDNRNVLQLMDEAMTLRVEAIVENAMNHHEIGQDHWAKGAIEEIAADQARETLSEYARRQEGWVTKDQVHDLITEVVDEELDKIDWEERVKDVLREML